MRKDICHYYEKGLREVFDAYYLAATQKFGRDCKVEPLHTLTFGLNMSFKYNMNGGACTIHFMPYGTGTAVDLRYSLVQLAGARCGAHDRDLSEYVVGVLQVSPQDCKIDVETFLLPENQKTMADYPGIVTAVPATVTAEPVAEAVPAAKAIPSFCWRCGAHLDGEYAFCPKCGGALNAEAAQEVQAESALESTPEPEPIPEPEAIPEPEPEVVSEPEPIAEPAPVSEAPVLTPKFCRHCGAPLDGVYAFCPKCGGSLKVQEVPVPEPEIVPEIISEPEPEIVEPEPIPEPTPAPKAPVLTPRFCRHCGAPLDKDTPFCPQCGGKLR